MTVSVPSYSGPALCALPAREVVQMLKSRALSPHELLEASLQRIAAVSPAINATITVCEERARTAIRGLERLASGNSGNPGWLAGLPLSIKDLTHVAGVRTTFGCVHMKDFVPETSDPLVERLETRGGIIVGKTNTPEFGAGGNTVNGLFGATRNPWDTRRSAGGSSGGAAASLAAGEVWLAHGTDLAGSARTPAAFCGIVGFRPSPGRCGGGPAETGFALEALAGPMARDVEDLALFLDAMVGYDPRMPISLEAPATSFQDVVARPAAKARIAFSEDLGGFAPVEPEIRGILRAAMEKCAQAGHFVHEACPDLPGLYETYRTLRGIHYGAVNAYLPMEIQAQLKETLTENIAYAKTIGAQQIYEAMRQRTHLYHIMRLFLEEFDVLAIPTAGLAAGFVEEEYPASIDGQKMSDYVDWLRFSFLAPVTTLPAIALPVGRSTTGMPVAIQLIGGPRGEAKLLQVARAVEQVMDFPKTPIDPVVVADPNLAI